MCPCDMPTGHVCGHCRANIRRDSKWMTAEMLRHLYGSKLLALASEAVSA